MATLPDVRSYGPSPQPQGGVAVARPQNILAGVGEQISAGGRNIEEASNIVAMANERQDALVAQAAGNKLREARMFHEFDPKTGFRSVKEGGTVSPEYITGYGQKFEDSAGQIRAGLSNENQKRMFEQHAQIESLNFKSGLLQHQAGETEKFNDTTANSTLELSLRSMAQRPTDELNFQSEMAKVNATVDATGKRKGLPAEVVAELKGKYLDAAYISRIQALMHGIPGVVEADPEQALAMFKQVEPKLGPQAIHTLSPDLLRTGIAGKAQTLGAEIADRFDYLHTGDAIKAIDASNLDPTMKIAVRSEVEHRHAVQQSDADKSNAVYIGKLDEMVQRGMSLAAITKTQEFGAVRDKGTVLKLVRERTEHAMNLQNAMESRDYTRIQRLRAEQEFSGIMKTQAYSDPMVLSSMTRPQVQALALELGPHNTQALLNKFDSFEKHPEKLREAKMDTDQFNTIADSLGLHPFKATTESDKRTLGVAKERVEAGINAWQIANGNKEMPREEKEKLMRRLIATQITVGGWWNSKENILQVPEGDIKQLVVPDVDKGMIITRLKQVKGQDYTPTPEEIGRAYLQRKQRESALGR
jgi:hypothetical protein